jgi:hypothetical protein
VQRACVFIGSSFKKKEINAFRLLGKYIKISEPQNIMIAIGRNYYFEP